MSEDLIEGSQPAPMVISREDLYELAWSKPMRELARDFGISDVALAKRCRRLGIPLPGRGYWARVDGGQAPYRPKLPSREPKWGDHGALTVAPSVETETLSAAIPSEELADAGQNAQQRDKVWLEQHLAFEQLAENIVQVPQSPYRWDPAIQGLREALEAEAVEMGESKKASERYEKLPEWRKRTQSNSEGWKWQWAENRGQRMWDHHKPVALRVSLGTYKRALSVSNALALAANARGFVVRCDSKNGRIVFSAHDAEIQMRVTENLEARTRAWSATIRTFG